MRYQFTNEGFVTLQEQLHQLDNPALTAEAKLIRADFGEWLNSKFELSQQQQVFFSELPLAAVSLYSAETAFAVENRLMVTLDKDEKDKEEQGKIIWDKSSLSAKSGINGIEASGTLTFYVRYTEG